MFAKVKWLALQQPLILLAGMMTGRNVMELLALNIHERAKLLDVVVGELKDVTGAMVMATDPQGAGGITVTEEELAIIVDEADDPKTAVTALLAYRVGEEGSSTGQ